MGLFSKKQPPAAPEPPARTVVHGQPQRKDRPTPTRREAEAAKLARLHPELDPKKAKVMNREAQADARRNQLAAVENTPARVLLRNVIDTRFNVGEIALPVMMGVLVLLFIPQLQTLAEITVYAMWGLVALIAVDGVLMWRKFKRLAAERIPGQSLKGLGFYGWNRQMSFRRWRQPAPVVKRGEAI